MYVRCRKVEGSQVHPEVLIPPPLAKNAASDSCNVWVDELDVAWSNAWSLLAASLATGGV